MRMNHLSIKKTTIKLLLLPLLLFSFVNINNDKNTIGVVAINPPLRINDNNNNLSEEDTIISLDRISNFIDDATSYLSRVCHTVTQDPTRIGKFTYTAYLDEELPTSFPNDQEDYNLLRHNGAIYALVLSYNRSPSPILLDTIQSAAHWLKTVAIGPVPDMTSSDEVDLSEIIPISQKNIPNLLAAWESGVMKGGQSQLQPSAKLGGAGLALVALVGLEKIVPNSTPLEDLLALANFIDYLQKKDGSFTCRYKPHKGGRDDSWVSLFYPGEASLGLMYLVDLLEEGSENDMHRTRYIRVATKALLYLEKYRRNMDLAEVEPDHWALLATSKLLPLMDTTHTDYYRIYSHAVKVITSIVAKSSRDTLVHKYKGCHTGDGETCTTSTQIEGMMAGLTFVKDDEMFLEENDVELLRDRMVFWIQHGADFVTKSQYNKDNNNNNKNMFGGVPRKFPQKSHDQMEVRIDYVQHSMSGIIALEQFLLGEGAYAPEKKDTKIRKVASSMKNHITKAQDSFEETPLRYILFLLFLLLMTLLVGMSLASTTQTTQYKKSK